MLVRAYRPEDASTLARLYFDTVRTVNLRDYSPAQVRAWAQDLELWDMAKWAERLARQRVHVAEEGEAMAGFCTWEPREPQDAYLDLLFVHHAWQRRGVATLVYLAAEAEMRAAGVQRIETHASVTAQPFFARHGFTLVRRQLVLIRGVELPNAVMEKPLAPG